MARAKSKVAQLREDVELAELEAELSAFKKLQETNSLWDEFVDPMDAYRDPETGEFWNPLDATNGDDTLRTVGFNSEWQLQEARVSCRNLAMLNEFAINAHQNRINYIIGTGMKYEAVPKSDDIKPPQGLIDETQKVIEEFTEANNWADRQEENLLRLDRDGEAFIRMFEDDGLLTVRAVEPGLIRNPNGDQQTDSFGIRTKPKDVEAVLAYLTDEGEIPAREIQHRKANVDLNVKRGIPLLFPVRRNLDRAEKLLRNMSVLAGIQSSIAMIRKLGNSSENAVRTFADSKRTASRTNSQTGRTTHYQSVKPGRILDSNAAIQYEFPAHAVAAANFVTILQAELRAIAARLVMPEWMFTNDASNNNRASAEVTEGPPFRMFQRLQAKIGKYDQEIFRRQIELSIRRGRLPANVLDMLKINAVPASLCARDRLEDAQRRQILRENGILSPQTWAKEENLDYERESDNILKDREKMEPVIPDGGTADQKKTLKTP